jgi:fibronectin type 3 domain-containing protein
MRRLVIPVALCLLLAGCHASTTPPPPPVTHYNQLAWSDPDAPPDAVWTLTRCDSAGACAVLATTTETAYQDTAIVAGQAYTYQVATTIAGQVKQSNTLTLVAQ